MRYFSTISAIWIAIALSARAISVEIPLTADTLDQQNDTFAVSASSTNKGTVFHVTITAKKEDIDSDAQIDLRLVTRTDKNGSITISGAPITSEIPLKLKKEKRTWTADFNVPAESLKTPNLYFIFTEFARTTVNGKRIAMPSVTFYEIKLTDFVKE